MRPVFAFWPLLACGCGAPLPAAATAWSVVPEAIPLGACAIANANVFWKQPGTIAIAFRLDNPSKETCTVEVVNVTIETTIGVRATNERPPAPRLAPSTTAFIAIELPLNSKEMWSRRERALTLALRTRIDGAAPTVAKWRLVR